MSYRHEATNNAILYRKILEIISTERYKLYKPIFYYYHISYNSKLFIPTTGTDNLSGEVVPLSIEQIEEREKILAKASSLNLPPSALDEKHIESNTEYYKWQID